MLIYRILYILNDEIYVIIQFIDLCINLLINKFDCNHLLVPNDVNFKLKYEVI